MKSNELLNIIYIVAALFVLKKVSDIFSDPATAPEEGASQSTLEPNTNGLTYDLDFFKVVADGIAENLRGFSEDDEAVFWQLVKMRSTDDVKALIVAFGVRDLGPIVSQDYNLPGAINAFLDTGLKNQINQLYSDRGIKIQF